MTPERSPHSERDLRVPEVTRCWESVAGVLPPSDPMNPEDPSVNLDTLAAIANAKWWQAHDLEEQYEGALATIETLEDKDAMSDLLESAEADCRLQTARAEEAEARERRLLEQVQTWEATARANGEDYQRLKEQYEVVKAQADCGGVNCGKCQQCLTVNEYFLKEAVAGLKEQLEALRKALELADGCLIHKRPGEAQKVIRAALSNPAMSRPEWATGEACVSKCVFCESKNVWEIGSSAWKCADCGAGGPGVLAHAPARIPE